MKRILLTGATGFVGRCVVGPLIDQGFEVHAACRNPDRAVALGAVGHAADLLAAGAGEDVIRRVRPTHLLHLAWDVTHGAFWTSPANLRWVGRSLDLLDAFVRAGGERVVMAGTCAEYAPSDRPLVEGRSALAPGSLYGTAKLSLGQILRADAAQRGYSAAWGRFFYMVGADEPPVRFIPAQIAAVLKGAPISCRHPWNRIDYMDVRDAGAAMAALAGSRVEGPVNIASGEGRSLDSICRTVADAAGRPDLYTSPDGEPDEGSSATVASVLRLRDEVGFVPERPFDARLREIVSAWVERGPPGPVDPSVRDVGRRGP